MRCQSGAKKATKVVDSIMHPKNIVIVLLFSTICSSTPIKRVFAEQKPQIPFGTFLQGVKADGIKKGLSASTLDAALDGIAPLEQVIKYDRNQPEFKQSFWDYQKKRVTKSVIKEGKAKLSINAELLSQTEAEYGVPSRFIVAFWGMESRFGKYTGKIPIVQALATLAWDPRRSKFFRRELLQALTIIDRGYIDAAQLKGSWAGAMGQMQFIPSSYMNWAVDANGDGKRDLWSTPSDIFASAANYLKSNGWNASKTWGRRVHIPVALDRTNLSRKIETPLEVFQAMGVRRITGGALPRVVIDAGIIFPDESDPSLAYLIYQNFNVILHWNRSDSYAIAIGRLADSLR